MSVLTLSLSAGTTVGTTFKVPMSFQNWNGTGVSALLNFSGQGGTAGAGGTAAVGSVTLQVSNDPNANPTGTTASTARWNNHDILVSKTSDQNSSIVYPCAYVRLVGTVTSGTVVCYIGLPDTSSGTP
jgi:hypothetical protein